jgi:exodeoxyribonuclease V beta subunit
MSTDRAAAPPPPVLLDALRLPLRGSRLIEASAGTGKTFTIAALYLRLVLGHGEGREVDEGETPALMPPDLLVVTFTDAATQELRDRIRARLAEGARAFQLAPSEVAPRPAGEDFLHDLRAEYPPGQWPECAQRLRLAAEWMDEAAVSTIHGWCQRMLSEHAFDSGSLFTQTLETDQRELHLDVVRDWWRTFATPLRLQDALGLRGWWATPAELHDDVRGLWGLLDALPPGAPPAVAVTRRDHALAAMKAPWAGPRGWAVTLLDELDRATKEKRFDMLKRKDWMQHLRDWAEGVEAADNGRDPKLTETAWARLSPEAGEAAWAGDERLLAHPGLQALATMPRDLAALEGSAKHDVLVHAARWTAARLALEQQRRAQMGFDELLTRLDDALRGPNGERLASIIRAQFPVALIDEFQDTDPLQYRLFDAIYGVARDDPRTALLIIGDPKQAIYAFRGADIHTYLAARRAMGGRQSTLGTNYRSTDAMVDAVNRVFLAGERRPGGLGAFRFGAAGTTPDALPFHAVAAHGRRQQWRAPEPNARALTFWTMPGEQDVSVKAVQATMAAGCATAIVRVLLAGQAAPDVAAGFVDAGQPFVPVRPGDIAVLVNSGREAREVRRALAARGVRSVYLSDKESVYRTAAAQDVQHWLAACAEPDDGRLLHAALATGTLGRSWNELDALNRDELAWEARVLQFRSYRDTWQRRGVLPMLRALIHDFEVPQRLLGQGDERTMTDLLHLAELLQQAGVALAGEHALIRHLAEARADPGAGSDAVRQRLESDADLVKVVTVHKSKGLEYPLVYLPFATSFRAVSPKDAVFKWHDDAGRLCVALQADDAIVARADEERLGEDLRKLYVALTRARYATWVGVAPVKRVERSAIGALLAGDDAATPSGLADALWELQGEGGSIGVEEVPEASDRRWRPHDAGRALVPEPALREGPREAWWIASYSALRASEDERVGREDVDRAGVAGLSGDAGVSGAGGGGVVRVEPPSSALEDIYADSRGDAVDREAADAAAADASLHAFPGGARAGTFLHALLEWAGRAGFGAVVDDPALAGDLRDLVARRCNLGGWSRWIETLQQWLPAFLSTPLPLLAPPVRATPDASSTSSAMAPAPTMTLASLHHVQVEMEFWFATRRVDTRVLDALVTRHTQDGRARPALQPQQLDGMLKGFVDLVFAHDGRYWVADWKSNRLGRADDAYTAEAMRDEVLSHRYELQYAMYVFALHRHLRTRLPAYDYDAHVGGALCVFLRGHAGPARGVHAERPPRALIDALDALFDGSATRPPAPLEEAR